MARRAPRDLDIFVRPDAENAERVMAALPRFGAPVVAHGVSALDLTEPGTVYQLGLPPNRIDILTEISGVSFVEASQGRSRADSVSARRRASASTR